MSRETETTVSWRCDGCGTVATAPAELSRWRKVTLRVTHLEGAAVGGSRELDLCSTCQRDTRIPGVERVV